MTHRSPTNHQPDEKPTEENGTLFQGFEWNVPADKKHYQRLTNHIEKLHDIGVTALWLPPGCKASSPEGNGYDIYDLWDLGEFDQKDSKATKWGTRDELNTLAKKAKDLGVGLYWDAVLNHKAGADHVEKCRVIKVDENERDKEVGEPYEIEAWVGFDFKGRGDQYSKMKWHWEHFSGTDWDQKNEEKAIYKILGDNKGWSKTVDNENGNADYMMYADIDYSHPEVEKEVKDWGVWITKELDLKGFRLDAVQHFSERFTNDWVEHVRHACGRDVFMVGEFWVSEAQVMCDWLEKMGHRFSLFDAPLLYNFQNIGKSEKADLRKAWDGSLVSKQPQNAVTCIQNHDTQLGQTMETPIEGWFKPLAYAMILLRDKGYPSIFYGDLYGTKGDKSEPPSCGDKLADIALARKLYAYGEQNDYFDDPNCIGWVRRGTWDRKAGCAVVMSNADDGQRRMFVGEMHAGQVWTDVLGWEQNEATIGDDGFGEFNCPAVSMAIYVRKDAEGRDKFPVKFDANIYGE